MMKFAHKIVLGTSLIIAICFSAGGTYMINQNYHVAYDNAVEANTGQHIMNRYSLESNIKNSIENGHDFNEDMVVSFAAKIDNYGKNQKDMMILDGDNQVIYSNMGDSTEEIQGYLKDYSGEYYIYEKNDIHKMLIATIIKINNNSVILLNQYDITSVYQERDRQIGVFIKIDITIVLLSILLTYLLSYFLTKKIKTLNRISGQIAQGDYSQRTDISSSDEIGEFSQNFDLMAQAVEDRIDQLEGDIKAREEFVSDFSHELSTPMTSIMGYSKLLLEKEGDHELHSKGLHYIYGECRRLENLSGRMMELMGISEKAIKMQPIQTDYISQQVEELVEKQLKNSKLTIEVEHAAVLGNSGLLVTLLRNLVENGDRACRNSESGVIILRGKSSTDGYIFDVTDNGCGIEKEDIQKITRAFYRVDKARSRREGGNGLGLSICNKICIAHGTELCISSKPGKGSSFSFILVELPDSKIGGGDSDD